MVELATRQVPKLLAIANLFEALHENGIVYCNLKGNDRHLRNFMTGESDIDVLFDEKQKEKLESTLHTLGFKKFTAIKQKQYKDIVDFITLDSDSGKVIHLHTYYRLTIGEPYLKGYQLDIENHLLKRRVFNEESGLYCIHPAFELILLYLTESLKLRHRDLILMYLRNKTNFSEKAIYEHNWLRKRTNDLEVETFLKTVFKHHNPIYDLVKAEFNRRQLHKLSPIIKRELSRYRLYSPFVALLLRWYRETTVSVFQKLSRVLAHPILSMRTNPRGGIIVAVVGADGSGRSTVANNLKETFRKKLDVYKVTFGRNEEKISRKAQVLIFFKTLLGYKQSDKKVNDQQKNNSHPKKDFVPSLASCIAALFDAREKYNTLRLVETAKKKGALVICDRYPQNWLRRDCDGPVLHGLLNSTNFFFRVMAGMEAKLYAETANHSPDLIFQFTDAAEVFESVRPAETLDQKRDVAIAAINQQRFIKECRVVSIDGARPLAESLYKIKGEIWNVL